MKNLNKKMIVFIASPVFIAALIAFVAIRSQSVSTAGETIATSTQATRTSNSGKVTMIDLGAAKCVPCKMMAPILEELKKEYAGRADIIFIDVWKDRSQAKKYGIRAIPTQIFFDASGREVYRHTGFMDKKRIVETLSRLGVS
ncbi:MAG TPA: thioredoxin family protein [Desulfobacteraceae bacterium]|nr:thioredoxin family protein [Desulfobacteraceae bacterium]